MTQVSKIDTKSSEFETMWEDGFRPYEVYTKNEIAVLHNGDIHAPGTITGWDIKHVFAKRSELKSMPFFDVVICGSSMSDVTEIHKELAAA